MRAVCCIEVPRNTDLFQMGWKHFDLPATWKPKPRKKKAPKAAAVAAAAAVVAQAEDEGHDSDGETVDAETVRAIAADDADDMHDAAQLIGKLVALHGDIEGDDAATGDGGTASAVMGVRDLSRQLARLFADFNAAVQQEWNDRRFRFRQLKLLRTREAAAGKAGEGERDYLCLEDSLALVFLDDKGAYYWCLARIEDMAVARSAVTGKFGQGDLDAAAATADHRTKVDIDDENAMFLLRWYQEVDKDGTILEWYGNPNCAAYHLPLNNGGYPFLWTSNHQVVCAVTLSRADDGVRTWTLRKSELAMIKAKVADVAGHKQAGLPAHSKQGAATSSSKQGATASASEPHRRGRWASREPTNCSVKAGPTVDDATRVARVAEAAIAKRDSRAAARAAARTEA